MEGQHKPSVTVSQLHEKLYIVGNSVLGSWTTGFKALQANIWLV